MRTTSCLLALVGAAVGLMGLAGCGSSEAKDPDPQPPLALTLQLGDLFESIDAADVPVTFLLSNVGATPAFVNSRFLVNAPGEPHEVVLEVIGPDKGPRRFSALVNARAESRSWKTVASGTRVFGIASLGKLFDLSQKGFYAVQAIYENAQDAPAGSAATAWKGRVASNVLRLEIK
jgi:hypothetical protein